MEWERVLEDYWILASIEGNLEAVGLVVREVFGDVPGIFAGLVADTSCGILAGNFRKWKQNYTLAIFLPSTRVFGSAPWRRAMVAVPVVYFPGSHSISNGAPAGIFWS